MLFSLNKNLYNLQNNFKLFSMLMAKIFFIIFFKAIIIKATQLYGNAQLGYYYMNFYVGTPAKLQTVIIDTGSWLTAFPCSGFI